MTLTDPSFRFTWLIWASAFLLPWALLFVARPDLRRPMLWASVLTAPFGLTEPLFVPRYWNPPTLFDFAQRTGFDLESLIFCFALGGLGVATYRAVAPVPWRVMDHDARHSPRHRWHLPALASPVLVFGILVLLPWNPIYPGILAMLAGALATLFLPARPLAQLAVRRCSFLAALHRFPAWPEVDLARVHRSRLESGRLTGLAALGIAGRGIPVRLCFRHLLERRLRTPDLAAARRRPRVARAAIGSVHQ